MDKLIFVDFIELMDGNTNITDVRVTDSILNNENGPKLHIILFTVNLCSLNINVIQKSFWDC